MDYGLVCNFKIYRISPRLGEELEKLTDSVAGSLGGIRNIEDLRSLSKIHNRVDWSRTHRSLRVKKKLLGLETPTNDNSLICLLRSLCTYVSP